MQLNKLVQDHFNHPRHQGLFEESTPDVLTAYIDSPTTGRLLILQLRVKDDTIFDIRFKAHGCAYTIATASYLTELCLGKTLSEVQKITRDQLSLALDLPAARYHCAVMAEDALKTALKMRKNNDSSNS